MMLRLRPLVILALGALCLDASSLAYARGLAQAGSSKAVGAAAFGLTPEDSVVTIPGPLRSFLRMAGISQKISAEDVLPLLARHASIEDYHDHGKTTEAWLLLERYVQQAKQLQALAGPAQTINVANCEKAGPLLHILGFKLRDGCNPKNIVLVTDSPDNAFLTLDSGFPVSDLEEALQKQVPFSYPFPESKVPALFKESDWVGISFQKKSPNRDLLTVLLRDPDVSRLYWALSKNDNETRLQLKRSPGLGRLLSYAAVLDFYGSEISIRSGHVVLPGPATAQRGWKDLVGDGPESPGNFVLHLVQKDNGWLAAYFDVLSRLNAKQQEHFTQAPRLKDLYEAFRATGAKNGATKGVFRKAPQLLVLFTRVQWEANGDPHVPGNLDIWKEILNDKANVDMVRDGGAQNHNPSTPEQLLETITSYARIETNTGPLPVFVTLNEIDGARPAQNRLSPETVSLLAKRYADFDNWYLIFSEFPTLDNASITGFIDVANTIDKIRNQTQRANVLGSFQANIGIWQILARQGEIPKDKQNASWQKVIAPFAKATSGAQLYDAARSSLGEAVLAATGKADISQEGIISLLAGPAQESAEGQRMHQEMAAKIRSVLDDQRLVSLDTLAGLSTGLAAMARGEPGGDDLLSLADELRDFEMPQPIVTDGSRNGWAPAVYASRHAELQVRTDLTKVIKTPGSRAQLDAARGQLAPFIRDTLVGLNYAYYEPPGAQMLHNNPLFIRAHDFTGTLMIGTDRHWLSPQLVGVGAPAGGGAYLMGSLSDLPYALAQAEQTFIVSENIQALIWRELVPKLLIDATLPRWWGMSPNELHAVALYQELGEELLTQSAKNAPLRNEVVKILSERMAPKRLEWAEQPVLRVEDVAAMLPELTPADTFYLGVQFRKRFPTEGVAWGPIGQQLEDLYHQHPEQIDPERLTKDFGVPHPRFSRTYGPDLLNVKPLYFSGGDSSRLFGESWESSNLYWARLADEKGYSPVMLNRLVPELTRSMIAKIFATDLDDWPALLRAMHETGEEFRQGKIDLPPAVATISKE